MKDIEKAILLLREVEKQLKVCIRCGMCQAVCPVFLETGNEADVARGKLALIEGMACRMFKDPKGVAERLDRCLLCGSCAYNCPRGVDIFKIFIKARFVLSSFAKLSFIKKKILRLLLTRPEFFDKFFKYSVKIQVFLAKPANKYSETPCSVLRFPFKSARHFVPPASVPFHHSIKSLNKNRSGTGIKAAFFTGCIIDKFFPDVAKASYDVLNYHNIDVIIPDNQGCCGIPFVSTGDFDALKKLMLHNLQRFNADDFDYLITSCATCTFTIKKILPMIAADNSWPFKSKIDAISKKTLDISRFLISKVGIKKNDNYNSKASLITYHDPCHLSKSLGVSSEPRDLIKANRNYQLEEMDKADSCCGMGGSFNLSHYDISSDIGMRKAAHIKATGSSVVATGCPACMLQLSDMLSKTRSSILVKHFIEIYAESLGLNCVTARRPE